MSDCPNSSHGHELTYKNQYRILSTERIAQSCYCIHCGDEMRRVYERQTPDPAGDPDIEYTFTDTLVVVDPENIIREVDTHRPLLDYVEYRVSHVESRPLNEPGTHTAKRR